MISRIYVIPKEGTTEANSYLIDSKLSKNEIEKLALALTNPILEKYCVDELTLPPPANFSHAIEIGFLPGVTDNVAHTVRDIAIDMFHLKEPANFSVYTSKIYFISGSQKIEDLRKIAIGLYNTLIERATIIPIVSGKLELPMKTQKVVLEKKIPVEKVSLNVDDSELKKISKEGIEESDGSCRRRGPLALDLASMKVIKEYFAKLKRDPTDIELETLAQTWSEHCKHTIFANPIDEIKDGLYKTYIKGATNLIRKQKGKKDFCVSVFSDNAGAIAFDENFLITHKVETHNSPSALDPYGGAITGIVGVNRDTIGFGLGAKPVANTYGFCFGNPEDERKFFKNKDEDGNLTQEMLPPRRIMEGVVKGINVGGNCSGIPTLSGFIRFDDRYRGKPLVFAGTVGLIPKKIKGQLAHEKEAEAGDYIVMAGGRVGLDGIHGATFSSVSLNSSSPATAVQIGDPITQKKLSDAIIKEARGMGLYNSITDNGAGGLSSSVAEMAKECGGLNVSLEKVPLKYPGLSPWEIWISESQERMTLSVPKNKWPAFHKLMERRGVEAAVIGEFTDSGRCVVGYEGKKVMDLDMEFLHNGLPKHHLTTEKIEKKYLEPVLPKGLSRTKVFEDLLGEKNVSGFAFISEQYDHEVQASSVLKPLSGPGRINTDAQVFRPVLNSNKGVALSASLYPSYGDLSPYHMTACALDTAIRNIVAAGGTLGELAILDNTCWCSSYDKTRLYELREAIRACYDYAVGYGTPFISGKDSMFNDFKGFDEKGNPVAISIPPTLLISAISVMPDLNKTVSPEFKFTRRGGNVGDIIYLLGETHDELGASEYFKLLAKQQGDITELIGNDVPKVNLEKNLETYLALEKAITKETVNSALSVTSGGLGIAIAKAAVGGNLGCKISLNNLPGKASSVDAKLFSESQGRILVSVSSKNTKLFEKIMDGVAFVKLGKVQKGGKIAITNGKNDIVNTDVKKLHKIYHKFSNSQ